MRLLRYMLVALVVCLLASLAIGQTLEDKVSEFTLDNGMKFIVVERHVAPVFFAAILFEAGSINEWDGVTGISHLLEHMMFKGTKTMSTVSYAKEKRYLEKEDDIAASIGRLRQDIGRWRLEVLDDFSRTVISTLDDETRQAIGSDRAKELAALISILESGDRTPPGAEQNPTLLEDKGVNYLERYIDLKRNQLELERVMAAHRELIISEELWDTYVQNGGRMVNAFTINDLTAYFVSLPANRLELWMMLESDRMKEPVFREFYSERDVVAEEKRLDENDPEEALWDALMATAFEASPYRRPILGWMSDIQSITRQDLASYFTRFYAPNNAVAILVGDLDVERTRKLANRYFGGIRRQDPPDPVRTIEPEQKGERRVTIEFPSNPQVAIAYHVPVAPHPDSYAIRVLISILGEGRTSRLYKKIYDHLELTSRPPLVSAEPGAKLDNLLVIRAVPRHPHTTEEVEQAIYAEIEALKYDPPTAREVVRVRNRMDADMVRTLGNNVGTGFRLGVSAVVRGDWRAYLEDHERTKKVRSEQISNVVKKYLTPQNRTVATLVMAEEKDREGEGIDKMAFINWMRSLPNEEREALVARFRSMDKEERQEYVRELMKKIQTESTESE